MRHSETPPASLTISGILEFQMNLLLPSLREPKYVSKLNLYLGRWSKTGLGRRLYVPNFDVNWPQIRIGDIFIVPREISPKVVIE